MATKLTEEQKIWLKSVVDHFEQEDQDVRDRQIRLWRKLKLLWDGFHHVWYSEVAHDWRIWDQQSEGTNDQQNYDKPVNVFRAYLESIIAALSVSIPAIKCYPDDADNPLDLLTAKSGDKIAALIAKQNDLSLVWLHALFIYCTEGMVAAYNYEREDEKYGEYSIDKYEDEQEEIEISTCPNCGSKLPDKELPEEVEPELLALNSLQPTMEICPNCGMEVIPQMDKESVTVTRKIGTEDKPKSRQQIEVYGGLYIKVANYAKDQASTPYLGFSYETNYTFARDQYPELRDKIGPGIGSEPYARWGRTNPQYYGSDPLDVVTVRNYWLRPSSFEILPEEQCDFFKKKFPRGIKTVFINQEYAECTEEGLDEHWTLTHNPLSDFIYFDPIGLLLTSIQEITNDLVSLTIQTIEHGIPQTFADPNVLNFKAYSQMETVPGGIYPATPKSGKSVGEGFYEVKTATLSQEVLPFSNQIQQMGQLVSGALPSLFGGQMSGGSNTASEYSMSRAQALQRLQSTWKMFTVWWKNINGKVIPAYIKTIQRQGDERVVEKNQLGGFVNVLLRKSELEGKIGSYEIETNENLPMTWGQRRDTIMKLLEANNPQILAMLAHPENLPLIYESIGINDFYVPGEDDRNKQYNEIQQLVNSEPIPVPPTEDQLIEAEMNGFEPAMNEEPSIPVDPIVDNHAIEFEICRKWAVSEVGQLTKIENEPGYRNVLLHAIQHKEMMMAEMVQQQGVAPIESPTQDKNAPVGENVNVQS